MTDRDYRAFCKLVTARVAHWQRLLGIGHPVRLTFWRAGFDDRCDGDGGKTLMRTNASWEYGFAGIDVDYPHCHTVEAAELETIIVHELMHVILREMDHEGREHEEHVATVLAGAFTRIANA